jgi:hypothetical protein
VTSTYSKAQNSSCQGNENDELSTRRRASASSVHSTDVELGSTKKKACALYTNNFHKIICLLPEDGLIRTPSNKG